MFLHSGSRRFLFLLAFCVLLSPATAGIKQGSSLAYISRRVGKYPNEVRLLNSQPLSRRLRSLLGKKKATLEQNIQVQGPITLERGLIVISGNRAHSGGYDDATILIDTRRNAINVYLREEGKVRVYRERRIKLPLPPSEAWKYQ